MAATNWYVDAVNGSDAASGATWALAWKTLDKVIAAGLAGSGGNNIYFRTGIYSLNTTVNDSIAPIVAYSSAVFNFIGCGFVVFKQLYGRRMVFFGRGVVAGWSGVSPTYTFRNIFFSNFNGFRTLNLDPSTYKSKLRFENCIFDGSVGTFDNRDNTASMVTFVNCSSLPGTTMPDVVEGKYTTIPVTADVDHVKANNSSTNYGYLAFDGNAATYWDYASGTTNVRMNVDIVTPKALRRMLYGDVEATLSPRAVTIYGSNSSGSFLNLTFADNTGWDYIASVEFVKPPGTFNATYAASAQYAHFTEIENSAPYRYYSFKFATNWGGASFRLAGFLLQEASAYVAVKNAIDLDCLPVTATSFSQLDYTRCSKEGAVATGTNGAITNPVDRSTFTGALLPVPVQYSSGGVFVVADPLYMNINVVGATTPYFPCSSTGWANDTAFTSGTATISDTNGIDLASGSSAAVLSPVYDFARTANFAGVGYSATEITTSLGTASVTLQYRVSASAFYQTTSDAVLAWNPLVKLVDQSFSGRYLQYRVTLNLNG